MALPDVSAGMVYLARQMGELKPTRAQIQKVATEETKQEYKRIKTLIRETGEVVDNTWVSRHVVIEGIHHPDMALRWMAAIHLILTKRTSAAEIGRLLVVSPSRVRQQCTRRMRKLRTLVHVGEISEEVYQKQIVKDEMVG